ncbi:SDR family oxidoreductase [Microbulbifer variabilis]|uniref:SDR family oxidoreductase n=1 Tax=Microbulbifer variabilis TaxID=266805 RepID=UPI001CFCB074|nr:SDR family oxidoreductase [Microbulbifer variabilis]
MSAQAMLTVLVTGASGGIGSAISRALAEKGHRVLLQGRNAERLQQLKAALPHSDRHQILVADLLNEAERLELVRSCEQLPGGLDALINNAGVSAFALLGETSDKELARLLHTNLLAPMALTRDLLPLLKRSQRAAIINISSAFGHIGHPGFGAYGASKAGLHGFTETLRRELLDTGIRVHYLAPRAVDTSLNSEAVNGLNHALGNKSDPPEKIAQQCLQLLHSKYGRRRFVGWPERFFIKINALFPALVDSALAKKLPLVRQFAGATDPLPEPGKS